MWYRIKRHIGIALGSAAVWWNALGREGKLSVGIIAALLVLAVLL